MTRRSRRNGGVSLQAAWSNLWTPVPLAQKARLVARNIWFKLRTGSGCCGHPGEPGC